MDRITKDKADKAAWSGSQALFDALRKGVNELERQSQQLEEARDLVKNSHTVLNQTEFGKACGSVMIHWMNTLDVHHSIFHEIIKITTPLPGSDGDAFYKGFSQLLSTTAEAKKSVADIVGDIKQSVLDRDQAASSSSASDDSDDFDQKPVHEAPKAEATSTKKRKVHQSGKPISLPIHSAAKDKHVETEHNDNSDDAPGISSSRKIHEAKSKKKRHSDVSSGEGLQPVNSGANPTDSSNSKPTKKVDTGEMPPPPAPPVEKERKNSYEDITGEVDAALKAKEEKRKKKKDSKKRKRESIASSILDLSDAAEAKPVDRKVDKQGTVKISPLKKEYPPKKKAKVEVSEKVPTAAEGESNVRKEGKKEKKAKRRYSSDGLSTQDQTPAPQRQGKRIRFE